MNQTIKDIINRRSVRKFTDEEIDENDLNTKATQAVKFISKGDRVKVSLRFRGREMAHMNNGKDILDAFVEKVSDVAQVEKAAKMEGRSMIMFLCKKN